jgi:hypothetical protein
MSNWPDPEKPGVPLNPDRDGIHWLFNPDNDKPHPVIWVADLGTWAVGDVWTPRMVAEMGLHYLGPVLTPAEAAILRAENARLREALTNARAETFDAIVHNGIVMENLLKNINAALEVQP